MPQIPHHVLLRRPMAVAAVGLSLLAGLGATPPATAPATQPALTTGDVRLLHQLETGKWYQRQAVQQALASRGIGDAPLIDAMLARTTSPEAQARLHAVLVEMNNDKEIGTSLITLHYKNAPANTVYADLFRQAWAPLKCQPDHLLNTLESVSIDVDHQPFWTVMQRLGDTTHLGMDRPFGSDLLCRGDAVARGPQAISGGFLVVLAGARPFLAGNNAGVLEKYFWLDLAIYPEPKLNVLSIDHADVTKATDDHGNAVAANPDQLNLQNNVPRGGYTLTISFKVPSKNPGTHLVRFRATLRASVALQSASFDISDPLIAKPQIVNVNGLALKFNGCRKTNGRFYEFTFDSPPDPHNRFQQVLQSTSAMRIIDADGHDMQCFQSMTADNPAQGCSMSYTFGAQLGDVPPKRLVWEIPTMVKTVDIPVDFHDVNLDFTSGANAPPAAEDDDRVGKF